MVQVALAVVSWNTRDLLAACLDSLHADHEAGRADVTVIDNASDDGSAELVAQAYPWVRLIRADRNLGYGPAVNQALAGAEAGFVAAANADLRFAPDTLAQLLAAAERAPRAGAFAPRLIAPDGATQHSVHPFPTVRSGLLLSTGLAYVGPIARRLPLEGHWDPDVERDVDWAHGALLLVRRDAWDAVAGFDPEQWLYAEDIDLCWRLRRAGWRTRYVPAARVDHAVSAATASRWDEHERALRTQRATYAWLAHRRGGRYARAVAFSHLVGPAARARLRREGWRRERERRYAAMHRTGLESRAILERHRRGDDG